MLGKVAAHGNFGAVDAIDARIATRAAAQHLDHEAGNETEVHEVLGDGGRQLQVGEYGAFSDREIGQHAAPFGSGLPTAAEYEVENHFQFHFYSNSSSAGGNDQSHTRL